MQKDTYRRIKKFSENMEAMLRVYGMLELEDAYKIYCTLYDKISIHSVLFARFSESKRISSMENEA